MRVAVIALLFGLASLASASSCYSVTITPTGGSICPGGTASYCATSQTAANLLGVATTTALSAITTTTATAAGTTACALLGATPVTSFWTNPTNACPAMPICPSFCGGTTTAAPPSTTTAAPPCCSFIISQLNSMCTGANNLATTIAAGASLSGFGSLLAFIAPGATSCSASGCVGGTYACNSVQVTPSSLSMCPAGTASYCTLSPALAQIAGGLTAVAASALTTAGQTLAGTAFCTILGGTAVTSWWTTPANVCPPLPTCSASTCNGGTPAPPQLLCCSYLQTLAGKMCTGATGLTTAFAAGTSLNAGLTSALGVSTCGAAGSCYNPTAASDAMTVSHSVSLVLVMMMAAVIALLH